MSTIWKEKNLSVRSSPIRPKGVVTETPEQKRHWGITITDQYEEIAAVTVVSYDYVDYLQLAKQDSQWLIVNVIWTDNRAK